MDLVITIENVKTLASFCLVRRSSSDLMVEIEPDVGVVQLGLIHFKAELSADDILLRMDDSSFTYPLHVEKKCRLCNQFWENLDMFLDVLSFSQHPVQVLN